MARRTTKAQNLAVGLVIVLALMVAAIAKVIDAIGYITPLLICGAGIAAWIWYRNNQWKKRVEYLRAKYRDETIVQGILSHRFWQGQTAEQLSDSLGKPAAVDNKVVKASRRDIWKYNPHGTNRYSLRITLENDIVTGWDQKSW
jgi:hypothetical protein